MEIKEHIGNIKLLKLPKTAFLCSRKVPASIVLKCYDWAIEQREKGYCIISGFHSQIEKDVLHYLLKGQQPIILVLARGIKEKLEPEFKKEMEQKRKQCWRWGVQISDCRNRPLKLFDKQNYRPRIIGQKNDDYYIHPKWTDSEIKQFRRNIRRQNIAIRQNIKFYSKLCEQKKIDREKTRELNSLSTSEAKTYAKQHDIDLWFPGRKTEPISNTKLFDSHV